MELSYIVSEQDYCRVMELLPNQEKLPLKLLRRTGLVFGMSVAVLFLAMAALSIILAVPRMIREGFVPSDIWFPLVMAGIGCSVLLLARKDTRRGSIKRQVRIQSRGGGFTPGYFGPHKAVLDDGCLTLSFGRKVDCLPCASLTWEEQEGYLLLKRDGIYWDALPPIAFPTRETREAFLSQLDVEKGTQVTTQTVPELTEEAAFTVSYTWGAEEIEDKMVKASRRTLRTSGFWTAGRCVLTVISVLFLCGIIRSLILIMYSDSLNSMLIICFGMIFWVILIVAVNARLLILATPLIRREVRKQLVCGSLHYCINSPQMVSLTPTGFVNQSGGGTFETPWSEIRKVEACEGYLYFFARKAATRFIPPEAFTSSSQLEEMQKYAVEKITAYKLKS